MSVLRRTLKDQAGATVVEFALVAPAFLMIIIGGFYLGMLGFAASNMRYAVEAGARCASVKTTICSSNSTTVTYTQARFRGSFTNAPVFIANGTAACGHLVTGTLNFVIDTGIRRITVPLSARSCFP